MHVLFKVHNGIRLPFIFKSLSNVDCCKTIGIQHARPSGGNRANAGNKGNVTSTENKQVAHVCRILVGINIYVSM